jgi:soluble lytic murein transglycosylase-like protein
MPETAVQYGVANAFDPEANVSGGTRYLRDLIRRYHGNLHLALAAYNAGPGLVDAVHGIPAIPETRSYVARVIASLH